MAPLGDPLVQAILSDLGLVVLQVGPDLRLVDPMPGSEGAGSPTLFSAGEPVTALFPELLGHEADLWAVAQGGVARFELPLINRPEAGGTSVRYVTLVALPHPQAAGRLVLLVRDETPQGRLGQQVMQQFNEVRLLRAQLEAANAELVRLNEQKSAFLRMAAHDLRSPLAVMRGYVELVLKEAGPALGPDARQFLGIVLARSRQMGDLIDGLLDVERIESGAVRLDKAPLDMAALVEQVGRGFSLAAREKGLDLVCEVPAGLAEPLADRERIVQVLDNLVSNAVKFTPPGGRVTITTRQDGDGVVVEVQDTGPGIPEAEQARLFERFFRGAEARQRRIAGSGLGLSIARAIVEQHGGRVFVHSREGQGSRFGFSLPVPGV